ncbi:MAG: SPOR domain-containing protein [Bryobacteraceae bacterium]
MAKSDDGEFELVLGNRQLLSIFFLVVILFGVVFTMGYIVGRNSAPASLTATPAAMPPPVASRTEEQPPPPASNIAQSPESAAPASDEAAVETPIEETAAANPDEEPETAAAPPGPGEVYLQVAAVRRAEADVVTEVLRKKGFKVSLDPSPAEGLFRVLVGPLAGDSLARTKTDLESAGFKPFVRR